MCSLQSSYTTFRDIILYNHDTFTIDEVYDALLSKKKMKHLVDRVESQAEGLVVRGRTHDRNYGENMKGKSKYKNKLHHFCKKRVTLELIVSCCKIKIG